MPHPHGTINRYNNQRCRCDLCRAAIRNYRRERRAKAKPVPAPDDRRAHVSRIPIAESGPSPRSEPWFQIVHASCGHMLWFTHDAFIAPGGWVRCPWHPLAGVRTISRALTIPPDALPGSDADVR